MTSEDFQADVRQERRDRERAAQALTDAISAARDDLATEGLTLRRLELAGHIEDRDWWDSFYRLRDIADRLIELEGQR